MSISKAPPRMTSPDSDPPRPVTGRVKWFDPVKGFGFLIDMEGGHDILLHANVLRKFGQSSIVEEALVEGLAVQSPRGQQVVKVLSITAPPAAGDAGAPLAALAHLSEADLAALPILPARVKWFDRIKGFGFANVFGSKNDVFLHIEILHRSGFAELYTGEAVGLRVVMADRGLIAAELAPWESALAP